MKDIKINGKNLLSFNKEEIIKQIKFHSFVDEEMTIAYDDISNVYLLFSSEGWKYFNKFSFIYRIKTINCKDYKKLSLNKIKESIFD